MGFAFAVHVLSAKSYAYLVTDRESDGHSTGGTWRWLLRRPGEREVPEACREGPFWTVDQPVVRSYVQRMRCLSPGGWPAFLFWSKHRQDVTSFYSRFTLTSFRIRTQMRRSEHSVEIILSFQAALSHSFWGKRWPRIELRMIQMTSLLSLRGRVASVLQWVLKYKIDKPMRPKSKHLVSPEA